MKFYLLSLVFFLTFASVLFAKDTQSDVEIVMLNEAKLPENLKDSVLPLTPKDEDIKIKGKVDSYYGLCKKYKCEKEKKCTEYDCNCTYEKYDCNCKDKEYKCCEDVKYDCKCYDYHYPCNCDYKTYDCNCKDTKYDCNCKYEKYDCNCKKEKYICGYYKKGRRAIEKDSQNEGDTVDTSMKTYYDYDHGFPKYCYKTVCDTCKKKVCDTCTKTECDTCKKKVCETCTKKKCLAVCTKPVCKICKKEVCDTCKKKKCETCKKCEKVLVGCKYFYYKCKY